MVQTKQEAPYRPPVLFLGGSVIASCQDLGKKKRLPEGNLFCYASGTA